MKLAVTNNQQSANNSQATRYNQQKNILSLKLVNWSLLVSWKLYLGIFIFCIYLGFWNLSSASAASCVPIYGGGLTCANTSLTIQKQVLDPSTNHFVHDLGISDAKFQANDLITFQVSLTNTGNSPIQKTVVKDTFPRVVIFTDGPGSFDKSSNTLTFTVANLAAHHTQLFTISGRITSQDTFSQNTFCTTNTVSALPSTGAIAQDSSQFCLKRLTSTPATGPETMDVIALLPIALLGLQIKRFV